jgi:hypothetical protein
LPSDIRKWRPFVLGFGTELATRPLPRVHQLSAASPGRAPGAGSRSCARADRVEHSTHESADDGCPGCRVGCRHERAAATDGDAALARLPTAADATVTMLPSVRVDSPWTVAIRAPYAARHLPISCSAPPCCTCPRSASRRPSTELMASWSMCAPAVCTLTPGLGHCRDGCMRWSAPPPTQSTCGAPSSSTRAAPNSRTLLWRDMACSEGFDAWWCDTYGRRWWHPGSTTPVTPRPEVVELHAGVVRRLGSRRSHSCRRSEKSDDHERRGGRKRSVVPTASHTAAGHDPTASPWRDEPAPQRCRSSCLRRSTLGG